MHPVFFEIHSGLPREAPGSDESTRRALEMLPELPEPTHVLDIGCGPGAQTLELARRIAGPIAAVDNHGPFLDDLRKRAAEAGFADRIDAREGDMTALPFEAGSFDLIWSEGAIYIMGFAAGLAAWRPLLASGGCLAVTEATWLRDGAPEPCRAFWDAGYPAMTDTNANIATAREAGFRTLGYFPLPESDWWSTYYGPMGIRLQHLQAKYEDDAEALEALAAEKVEIDLYRRYSSFYGYVFYVLQRLE